MEKVAEKQRRKPKQARSIIKYNEILDACARVLQSLGFANATMQEISLESGHPYSTIYQYFANKEAIYMAWLERFIDTSLYGLSSPINSQEKNEFNGFVDRAVYQAVSETARYQDTLLTLFDNMPMITSKLVELMEVRTRTWLQETFALNLDEQDGNEAQQRMISTIRAGNGYWLVLTLSAKGEIDVKKESTNFATLVKSLLAH